MVPEDLLFWIAPMSGTPHDDQNVLCRRHADAMSVPRGWTLDDRREAVPRLFMPRRTREDDAAPAAKPRAARSARAKRASQAEPVEQLVIDGTGEIERPSVPAESDAADAEHDESGADPWRPSFDQDNDLDGLLEVSSPLLARAFRGTDRPRA
jgi:hypothetical protein